MIYNTCINAYCTKVNAIKLWLPSHMTVKYLIADPVALLHDRNVVQVHFHVCFCDCVV